MGIGVIEILILVGVGVIIVMAVRGGGRRAGSSLGENRPHPRMQQCPSCGTPLTENMENCPQCGLRILI